MKYLGMAIAIFLLALTGAVLGASNKLNWLTQILNGPVSNVAATDSTGAPTWLKLGNLTVTAGVLNAPTATINFANNIKVTATGSTITLPNTPVSTVSIDKNGITMDPSEFTVAGTAVTLTTAPLATDQYQATYLF